MKTYSIHDFRGKKEFLLPECPKYFKGTKQIKGINKLVNYVQNLKLTFLMGLRRHKKPLKHVFFLITVKNQMADSFIDKRQNALFLNVKCQSMILSKALDRVA